MTNSEYQHERRELLGRLLSAVCISTIVPKVLAAQGGGGGQEPTCTTEDVYCGLKQHGGQGPGHNQDSDCATSGSDKDCGLRAGGVLAWGLQDNDCSAASSPSNKDADCGIAMNYLGSGGSDSDCSGTNSDSDCGIKAGPASSYTDQDCAATTENNDKAWWEAADDPLPPYDNCPSGDNPPPPPG